MSFYELSTEERRAIGIQDSPIRKNTAGIDVPVRVTSTRIGPEHQRIGGIGGNGRAIVETYEVGIRSHRKLRTRRAGRIHEGTINVRDGIVVGGMTFPNGEPAAVERRDAGDNGEITANRNG